MQNSLLASKRIRWLQISFNFHPEMKIIVIIKPENLFLWRDNLNGRLRNK